MDRTYGRHPDQRVEVTAPDSAARGTIVLIHGGYWRDRFTLELMRPLAHRFGAFGWSVANVEYRRGPHQPWPAARDDVRAAIVDVRSRLGGPLVAIGHSVGGQLALLAADLVDRVVALAPVTDATRTFAEGLGDDAAREYFQATPDERPELFDSASPLQQGCARTSTLIVHGRDDARVPLAHSIDYATAAWDASAPVDLHVYHRLDHLALIDPDAVHWAAVDAWLDQRA